MTDKLKGKVDRAIRFLQSIKSEEIELSYSGGERFRCYFRIG